MKLDIDGKTLKQLTITATILLLITISTWTVLLAPALAQVAPTNSTAIYHFTLTPQQSFPHSSADNSSNATSTGGGPATKGGFQITDVEVTPNAYAYYPNEYATVKIGVTVKTFGPVFNTSLPI